MVKKFFLGIGVILVTVVGVYLLVFGFGKNKTVDEKDGTERGERQVKRKFEPGKNQSNAGAVTFMLKNITESADEVGKMEYIVKNDENKEIELEFGSSMKYDFYITDSAGSEVYRDSDGKAYMQVISTLTLAPGEEETFLVKLPKLNTGEYTLTIFLAAKGYNHEKTSIDFKVE